MKIILSILGGFFGIGALLPIIYETSDAGINYLNTHTFFHRGVPMLIGVVSAIMAGGLIGGWKDYTNFHWSETVAGESRLNPAWATLILALVINFVWIRMLE